MLYFLPRPMPRRAGDPYRTPQRPHTMVPPAQAKRSPRSSAPRQTPKRLPRPAAPAWSYTSVTTTVVADADLLDALADASVFAFPDLAHSFDDFGDWEARAPRAPCLPLAPCPLSLGGPMVDTARQLYDEVRQRVLRRLLRTDANITRVFEEAAHEMRVKLRAFGLTEAQIAEVVDQAFRRAEGRLLPQLEADLHEAAQAGDEAARRTLEQLGALGGEGAHPFRSAPRSRAHLTLVSSQPNGSGARSRETG